MVESLLWPDQDVWPAAPGLCAPSLPPAHRTAHKQIYYSDKYFDEHYGYQHVMSPRELSKQVPKTHLMSEEEWRRLGVQQSLGWVRYMIHEPEPHLLLFRRPLPKEQQK
ncbi:PREDICTED: cyclin-dependent kinases regulatory subunit 2-like [Odobenus rosmarus divergens]|uniref:Cyclin-dependent kinases regulatory subunit n=1 Tax=Odobenus rosmarus divergens TaxID=9708 RepID=A0A9B0GYP4_ODORO